MYLKHLLKIYKTYISNFDLNVLFMRCEWWKLNNHISTSMWPTLILLYAIERSFEDLQDTFFRFLQTHIFIEIWIFKKIAFIFLKIHVSYCPLHRHINKFRAYKMIHKYSRAHSSTRFCHFSKILYAIERSFNDL